MFSHFLVAWLKNTFFFSAFPAPGSFVCPCMIGVVQEVFHPLLSLSTQLQSLHSRTPPFLHPAHFHTAQGLAETHTPLYPSLRPSYSYQPGTQRTERKKEKEELQLSVRDYSLPLSTGHVPSIGRCFHKAKKWDLLQGAESYKL